ncbi:hypothetical protein [Chryseobacterium sp.]|uniref:hypothetical protein n=1 Tax=Chryseobacterium sp. TaxID=1871047 RepID=UPI0024E257E6|nr:hypothetical protein [Chryseobacterium sp.]
MQTIIFKVDKKVDGVLSLSYLTILQNFLFFIPVELSFRRLQMSRTYLGIV